MFILVLTAGLATTGVVQAQPLTCPAIAGGTDALAARPAEERLAFLRARLAREHGRVWDWSTGWKVTYGVLIGGQLALVTVLPRREHPDLFAGAITSGIGLASLLVLPRPILADQPAFEQRMALEGETADTCALLAQAEAAAVRDAADADFGRGWLIHTGNLLIAAGAAVALWQGYDDWESGLTAFATNLAVGEVMILTTPAGLEDDLARYRRGDLGEAGAVDGVSFGFSPLVLPEGGGLAFGGRF